MRNYYFIILLLASALCVEIAEGKSDADKVSITRRSITNKNIEEKHDDSSLQDPLEYVLGKLKKYDLVMIGERHWTKEEPVFIQNLIKRCYEKDVIDFVFLEFGDFEAQPKIDDFLQAKEYDPKPVIEMLKDCTVFGWGYQEYFDIFKIVYFENKNRPEKEKIRIILVDGSLSTNMNRFYKCFDHPSLQETEKWEKVSWLREGIAGRDPFMAEVIAVHVFGDTNRKGIYYAGGDHVRKDIRSKDGGLRLFSVGGILSRKYPGRICCLAFHKKPAWWQKMNHFNYLEKLYENHSRPFGLDSNNKKISHLKMKSDIFAQGVDLQDAFDGYIMLNHNKDYHVGSFIPDFYNDEFAQVVWDKLRKEGQLKRLPSELEKFKTEPWSGKELRELMKQGVH